MAGESARERARRARERAERLERVAETFEKGAEGESVTARTLSGLPSDWVVLHDLRWPGRRFANLDHLVIGPGGVFVVDSKNWSGRVSVENAVLRQNGRVREGAVAGCADSALAVAALVPSFAEAVRPVLCFVRDEPMRGWARDVMVCSTPTLLEMLLTRPHVLGPKAVDHLRWTLDAEMASAVAPTPEFPSSGRRRSSTRPSRGAGRKQPVAGRGCAFLVAVVALIVFGFPLAMTVGNALSAWLTDLAVPEKSCTSTIAVKSAGSCEPRGSRAR